MARQAPTKYRILNPRGIAKGVQILSLAEKSYYEGDKLVPPEGMPDELIERWVERGFIEVIDD